MSRGPSPAFSNQSSSSAVAPTSSNTSRLNPDLRVDTDPTHLATRFRSKSNAQPQPRSESPNYPIHHVSRSFSHATSPDSASSVSASRDVAQVINGLRNGSSSARQDARLALDVSALTMKRIHEAIERSDDEGDTLDLSKRGIKGIGVDAVEVFRKGVGKDHKGVWRYVPSPLGCILDHLLIVEDWHYRTTN